MHLKYLTINLEQLHPTISIRLLIRIGLTVLLLLVAALSLLSHAEAMCPTHIHNYHDCSAYHEPAILQTYPQLFLRKDNLLTVRLLNGKSVHFKDVPADSEGKNADDVVLYSVQKYFPEINYALISLAYGEGHSAYLLNLTNGLKTLVTGDAILSPDKRRLVVWNMEIEADYSPNILSVYRITNKGLILEFLIEPNDWGTKTATWRNNKTIEFSKTSLMYGGYQTQTHVLRFTGKSLNLGGSWQIE
ncbi:hypothetical protein [Methylotenera mobilis]|uniref:Uncharacterized protein n=1 Tax=Methylotenera mobilis (strain JLW8 / ATCC BAA-1282 / DSM 17540) TaxID=583345 RepID=C6WZ58_METML|nr:hypothetical protein [Methylotenera mobilis]ACT49006.1 hypothetical protein Mmol_2104 [Methylotenera mobilis JLW8]